MATSAEALQPTDSEKLFINVIYVSNLFGLIFLLPSVISFVNFAPENPIKNEIYNVEAFGGLKTGHGYNAGNIEEVGESDLMGEGILKSWCGVETNSFDAFPKLRSHDFKKVLA